jgi:hypothetical protein
MKVFSWPKVGVYGHMFTTRHPVQESKTLLTGRLVTSGAQRSRRYAALDVSGTGPDGMGAGWMEALKIYLDGQHAVRLYSLPLNRVFGSKIGRFDRAFGWVTWTEDALVFDWLDDDGNVGFYEGTYRTGTTTTDSLGYPAIRVQDLPASQLIARVGEFVMIGDDRLGTEQRIMVGAPAYSDADGVATIRLVSTPAPATNAQVVINAPDTGVFRPSEVPEVMRSMGGDWTYSWTFREIFEDELVGDTFVEENPWLLP